jgi:hypothetical protein
MGRPATARCSTCGHWRKRRDDRNQVDTFRGIEREGHLIGATTTREGLAVHAELDPGSYPQGIAVTE